jgi:hypothetical protein
MLAICMRKSNTMVVSGITSLFPRRPAMKSRGVLAMVAVVVLLAGNVLAADKERESAT